MQRSHTRGVRHCNYNANNGEGEEDFSPFKVYLLPDTVGRLDLRESYSMLQVKGDSSHLFFTGYK